jgi:hypothetical protein
MGLILSEPIKKVVEIPKILTKMSVEDAKIHPIRPYCNWLLAAGLCRLYSPAGRCPPGMPRGGGELEREPRCYA